MLNLISVISSLFYITLVSVPRQVLPSKEPSLPSKPAWKKGPNPYSLITEENLMATSVEGEIAKQQVYIHRSGFMHLLDVKINMC